MIAVVIIPAAIWFSLLVVLWMALFRFTHPLSGLYPRAAMCLRSVGLFKALFASLAAFATSSYSIGRLACYSGIFGLPLALILFLSEGVLILFLIHRSNWCFGLVSRSAIVLLVSWASLSLISFLAHLRSALLCTV